MSRITSGWRGANRILVAMLTSLLRQRDRRRHANLVSQDLGGVALARRSLDQPGVAGAEDVLGAVAQADLELAGEDDDELTAWGRMPVEVLAERPLAERDLRSRQALRPLRHAPEVDRLDARLPIGARVESKRLHGDLRSRARLRIPGSPLRPAQRRAAVDDGRLTGEARWSSKPPLRVHCRPRYSRISRLQVSKSPRLSRIVSTSRSHARRFSVLRYSSRLLGAIERSSRRKPSRSSSRARMRSRSTTRDGVQVHAMDSRSSSRTKRTFPSLSTRLRT